MKSKKMNDTKLLDYLQKLNDKANYTGLCMLRMSTTDRGWRLHETSADDGFEDVRVAIQDFAERNPL